MTLRRAISLARMVDELDVECAAASTLILGQLLDGAAAQARELAAEMEDRCTERLLRGTALQFAASRLWLDLHARGACAEVITACRGLLADPLPDGIGAQLSALLALALADSGDLREAELVVERALARAGADRGRALSWTRAEVMWLAGRAREAAALASECRDDAFAAYPVGALAAVTAGWARLESGDRVGDALAQPLSQTCGGSGHEILGIDCFEIDPALAGERFELGARAWSGIERRGVLRCAWAGAEAARRGGERDRAVAALTALRQEMTKSGLTALSGRVGRSLRDAGVRDGSARSADERGLTAREREILALVAQGLSTAAIARRLGLEGTTVETHIESAREKLGATNRTQAAILAGG